MYVVCWKNKNNIITKIKKIIMDGLTSLLGKLSIEDVEKLKVLMSLSGEDNSKEVICLGTFADEYKKFIKQNRSKAYYTSVNNSFQHLFNFLKPQRLIKSIGLKETEDFISDLQTKVKTVSHSASRGGEGYRVYVRTLKAAFNKAVEWGYVRENYFLKVKLPKKQKLNPEFISSDQLLAICGQLRNKVVRDVVVFAFYTGMRLDEIVNLRWKNVELQKRIITVGDNEFVTKGREQRFVPIGEEVMEVLSGIYAHLGHRQGGENPNVLLKGGENPPLPLQGGENPHLYRLMRGEKMQYVFCKNNGMKYTGGYFSKHFKKACQAAGISKGIHFHSLRHSFASNLVQQGVSIYKIKELLGHSSITTTEIYSHLNIDSLREAISKLDDLPNNPSLNLSRRERLLKGNQSSPGLKLIIKK